MTVSTAVSVAAYTTVVAETFAAVGLATLVPAAIVTAARTANAATEAAARSDAIKTLERLVPGGANISDVLLAVAESSRSMELLVPKTGKIHAEFAFEAREKTEAAVGVSALVEVVTVKGGYAGLYEASSKNKITMDVDFALVEFPLVQKAAGNAWKRPVYPVPP